MYLYYRKDDPGDGESADRRAMSRIARQHGVSRRVIKIGVIVLGSWLAFLTFITIVDAAAAGTPGG